MRKRRDIRVKVLPEPLVEYQYSEERDEKRPDITWQSVRISTGKTLLTSLEDSVSGKVIRDEAIQIMETLANKDKDLLFAVAGIVHKNRQNLVVVLDQEEEIKPKDDERITGHFGEEIDAVTELACGCFIDTEVDDTEFAWKTMNIAGEEIDTDDIKSAIRSWINKASRPYRKYLNAVSRQAS
jgi:hypothetical protein